MKTIYIYLQKGRRTRYNIIINLSSYFYLNLLSVFNGFNYTISATPNRNLDVGEFEVIQFPKPQGKFH